MINLDRSGIWELFVFLFGLTAIAAFTANMFPSSSYSWYWVLGSSLLVLAVSACLAASSDYDGIALKVCIFILLAIFIGCLPIIIVIFDPLGLNIPMCTWDAVVLTVVVLGFLTGPFVARCILGSVGNRDDEVTSNVAIAPTVFVSALLIIYGLWKMEDPGTLCITTISEGNAPLVRMHKELQSKIAEDEAEVAKADAEMNQLSSESARAMIKPRRDEINKRLIDNIGRRHLTEDLALRIYATRCLEAAGVDVAKDDIQKEAESIMKEILR